MNDGRVRYADAKSEPKSKLEKPFRFGCSLTMAAYGPIVPVVLIAEGRGRDPQRLLGARVCRHRGLLYGARSYTRGKYTSQQVNGASC